MEEAFNAVKYGEVPTRPVLEAILPSVHEGGMAPAGHHTLSAIVQYALPAPKAAADAARTEMLENALAVPELPPPCSRIMIAHAELLLPYGG